MITDAENKGRLQFLGGFFTVLLVLAVFSRWRGPVWMGAVIVLIISVVFAIFLTWLYFRTKKPPIQREFDFHDQ